MQGSKMQLAPNSQLSLAISGSVRVRAPKDGRVLKDGKEVYFPYELSEQFLSTIPAYDLQS